MRRGLLPVLLFLLAAGGTLFLGTRILASERVSAERTARERLRAEATEAAGILRGAALAAVHGELLAIASIPFLTERSRGAVAFEQPDEPRPLGRLAAGRDPEAGFYLDEGERAEAVEGDLDRAEGFYRAAAAEGRETTTRCIALFRIAALERRRDRPEAAKAAESGFRALAQGLDRATLESAIVGARTGTLGPDVQGLLIAAVGTSDEGVALGLLRDAGVAAERTIRFRREAIALMDRLRPVAERAFDERPLRDGATIEGGRLVAWRRGPEPVSLKMHIMDQPLPALPTGVRIQTPGGAAPSPGDISESMPVREPLKGVVVVASMPREAIEAAARRGAWLLGGALAALLLAGGAAFVLSVRAARREAEAARARADFVTKVGHDLRTPLAVVRMYAETLAAGKVADPVEAREFASVAVREAERLTGMVEQVLDLSRVGEGDGALARRPVDLAVLVDEVASVHRPLLERAGMSLDLDVAAPLPVLGDSAALRGAVSNLLENAGRHAASGGSVAIEAAREGRMAVLRVLDRGPGVPEEMEERLFERFVRGPDAAGSGAGLGLALVREAAEAHGGTAAASNREGGGAVFTVRLPLAEEEGA